MRLNFIFAALIVLASCSQPPLSLEHAYRQQSSEMLDQIMQRWHNTAQPISSAELVQQPDTVQAIYEIFHFVFDSLHSSVSVAPRDGSATFPYTLIQKDVEFFIADSLTTDQAYPRSRLRGTLTDFRPNVSRPGTAIVYMSDSINSVLTTFLSSDFPPVGTGQFPYERQHYLRGFIPFHKTSFGPTWDFATPPSISWVNLDTTLKRARVQCFMGSSVYKNLLMEKQGDAWVVLETSMWIIDF